MIDETKKYERYAEMNLEELKQQAEALSTPATAFDILTIHKALKHLETRLSEISDSMIVTVKNGSERKAKLIDIVLEIYEAQKTYRIRRLLGSYLKENKPVMMLFIIIFAFLFGAIFGIKIDLIKLIQSYLFN